MALPREYLGEDCALARALEIVGERWTLLIVRDAFYGVRRFSDFRDHLGVPRAVLTDRLNLLVENDILERSVGTSGRDEYALTPKGQRLWPAMWSLMSWGNDFYQGGRPGRPFTHNGCGGRLGPDGVCAKCHTIPAPNGLTVHPSRSKTSRQKADPVSQALTRPHKLLTPIGDAG
jgi:DNA-binding HxlR family transcriptional regulator